jgi:hypothetical protein
MPFITSFDDGTTVHPDSFWIIRYLSINLPNRDALLTYHGWHDAAAYANSDPIVGERIYNVNDLTTFEITFGQGEYTLTQSFYSAMDVYVSTVDDLFNPDTATEYSYLPLDISTPPVEIGSQGPSRLIVSWRSVISGSGSLSAGVTIKINGVAATINAATAVGFTTIYYDINEVVAPQDVVTFAYAVTGNLTDGESFPLAPIVPVTAVNTVGGHWRFDKASNSAQILLAL